jgi:hypothetical protein
MSERISDERLAEIRRTTGPDVGLSETLMMAHELASLRSEVAAAQQRIAELESLNATRNWQNAQAFNGRDEIERDARRYRYLRNQEGLPEPEEFDRMVDADIALLESGADPFKEGEKTDGN